MKSVRIGMVGAGMIAHHASREILAHGQAEISAAFDINENRLKELQKAFDIPQGYTRPEDIFADQDVDAVYIAVPNAFHAELAIAALDAGKHVILDKPFAINIREAEQVAVAVQRSGKLFTLGMNFRYSEAAQTVRSLVANGTLGEIYHAKSYLYRRSGIPRFGTWFCEKDKAGGGALLDIGVHMLDLALFITDNFQPVSVSGQTYRTFGHRKIGEGGWGMSDRGEHKFDVDDFAAAMIRLKNGAMISLNVTWAMHQKEPDRMNLEVYGSEGGASVFPLELYRFGQTEKEYQVIQNPSAELIYPHQNRFHNFINAILDEEALCVTLDQALTVQKILDAVYESSETGREVVI